MNNVQFFILFLQICFTLELGGDESHGGDLIKMKSGKTFLQRSRKEKISPRKHTVEESGHDLSNDEDTEVILSSISILPSISILSSISNDDNIEVQ